MVSKVVYQGVLHVQGEIGRKNECFFITTIPYHHTNHLHARPFRFYASV